MSIDFIIEDIDFYRTSNRKLEVLSKILDIDVDKTSQTNLDKDDFIFKETHEFFIQHIFSLTHKLRKSTESHILIQTSVNLNVESDNILIKLSEEENKIFDIDINQTLNLIKVLPNNDQLYLQLRDKIKFNFIQDNSFYVFYYSQNTIIEKIHILLNLPYYINIKHQIESNDDNIKENETFNDVLATSNPYFTHINRRGSLSTNYYKMQSDGVELFKEFLLDITIRKYFEEEVLIMIKIKENDNWTIVGKSRMIERIMKIDGNMQKYIEIKKQFILIPLQDGYIKLPEVEFMEYKITSCSDIRNVNSLEFLPLSSATVTEGNERIIKVYSINSCTLRLNLI